MYVAPMPGVSWISEGSFEVGPTRFHCGYPVLEAPPGHLPILKTPEMIDPYVSMIEQLGPRRIVELGIRRGGSTALLHELARPERLVAFELDEIPAEALSDFIAEHGLGASVRPHYGVDQADRARVAAIVDDELGDQPIDLVVDDASHLYDPTLASFEVLFPRLRPGGLFVIEDWTAQSFGLNSMAARFRGLSADDHERLRAHIEREGAPEPPRLLALLTLQLVLLRAIDDDIVRDVHVDRYWTVVRRGSSPLDRDGFRVRDHCFDHMRLFDHVLPPEHAAG